MSDESTPVPPAEPPGSLPDAINDQVRDAVRQVDALQAGQIAPFTAAVAFQAIAQAVALGMQNAVAQQQHAHMLRSALTTAAARALLDGKREEAEAVLKLAESRTVNPDLGEELTRLQSSLRTALSELRSIFDEGVLADLKQTLAAFDPKSAPPASA